jgi:hypothetical protein
MGILAGDLWFPGVKSKNLPLRGALFPERKVRDFSLVVHLVSFGAPLPSMLALENAFG